MPAVAAVFFRQANELNDATGFYLLRLSKLVCTAKRQRAKIPRATKEFNREYLQMMRWPALSNGLVLRAFGIRGRRGRRPMICFLAFLRSVEGQTAAQLPAGRSFDTAKGKERPPRGSRCRFIKMANHAKP
jgi:hypothetical protein